MSAYTPVGTAVASSGQVLTFFDETTEFTEKQWSDAVALLGKVLPPTCAGPLATHGTPVLRWAVKSKSNFAPTETKQELLCDGCYLERERNVAAATDADASWLADGLQPEPYTEPPARIGTVPQVVSVGVGIWASRGMRR